MSSIQPTVPKLDSVDSIYNYLREPTAPSEVVVSSTTPSSVIGSTRNNNRPKKQKKEKETAHLMNTVQTNPIGTAQILPSGRVRYGPVTVNPRKKPSKTLFTGRRSKYEVLAGEEEEKRRLRRERNRVAATKCRVKRDDILSDLETTFGHETTRQTHLLSTIQQLEQKKRHLQTILSSYAGTQSSQKVFGDTDFLSSIIDAPAPPLPPHQLELIANDEEEFNRFLQPLPLLTNSAYNSDQSDYLYNAQQQPQPISMSSGSIERILNNLPSPSCIAVDNNNNNTTTTTTCQELFNSAYGSSTCAQQHSSSSEDDSMPSTHQNSIVF